MRPTSHFQTTTQTTTQATTLAATLVWSVLLCILVTVTGLSTPDAQGSDAMTMRLTSTAFADQGMIPATYTCDSRDISPPLAWSGVPAQAKCLALLCDDPDAPVGDWVHWVIFNIPANSAGLAEAVPTNKTLPDGSIQGRNGWGRQGYGGPCPPGGTHRYFFTLFALDAPLGLSPQAGKADLLKAVQGHILAQAQLMGRYARR